MIKAQNIIYIVLVLAIVIVANLILSNFYTYIDLTEDKRFTLEKSTEKLLEDVDDNILIEILLDGELNAEFKKLQARTVELLKQFKNINPNIDFTFSNPSSGSPKEINQKREKLRLEGVFPTTLFIQENDQRVEKLIYPFAIVNLADRRIPVNLLEPLKNGSEDEAINRSMILLEYKFASNIGKLNTQKESTIVFTKGNGELIEEQTARLETLLSRTMNTHRINLDSTYQISQEVDILIAAGPTEEISTRSKFIIDQYIMNGGKVIWLIDQFYTNLDSINNNKVYVPKPVEHGLDDLFFKYGIRINKDIVLDLECSKIPQVVGYQGGKAQQKLFPWVYNPLLNANPENKIVKNIDRVLSSFPSTLNVLENENLESSILLTSSKYSRYQVYPSINLSFEILKVEQRPEAYNKSYLPVAVLIEGEFNSAYKNRVSQNMQDGLNSINAKFVDKSPETKQVFITDSDIIKNLYKDNLISPLGFNKWEGYTYEGNKSFIINTIDYLLDDYGLVNSRSKTMKVRLLDQVEVTQRKTFWQVLNITAPILFISILGLLFNFFRKKKYAQ